eukprot:267887_1
MSTVRLNSSYADNNTEEHNAMGPKIWGTPSKSSNLHPTALHHGHGNFTIRLKLTIFIMMAPIGLLLISTFHPMSVSRMIGIGLLTMFIIYFITIFCLVFLFGNQQNTEAELFRIYSISDKPPNWGGNLNICHIQLLYHTHSIKSISELSAINGAFTKQMLHTLGAYTWISIAIHYAQQTQHSDFHWDIAD